MLEEKVGAIFWVWSFGHLENKILPRFDLMKCRVLGVFFDETSILFQILK